jgi:ribosomal protein S16
MAPNEEQKFRLALDRVAHWVGQGAQPSDAVKKLIRRGKAQAAGQQPAAAK